MLTSPPQATNATVGFFKTGSPITVGIQVPSPGTRRDPDTDAPNPDANADTHPNANPNAHPPQLQRLFWSQRSLYLRRPSTSL